MNQELAFAPKSGNESDVLLGEIQNLNRLLAAAHDSAKALRVFGTELDPS